MSNLSAVVVGVVTFLNWTFVLYVGGWQIDGWLLLVWGAGVVSAIVIGACARRDVRNRSVL